MASFLCLIIFNRFQSRVNGSAYNVIMCHLCETHYINNDLILHQFWLKRAFLPLTFMKLSTFSNTGETRILSSSSQLTWSAHCAASGRVRYWWAPLERLEPASNLPSCEIAPHIDNWPSHPHSMAHWRPPPIRKAVRVYNRVCHIQEKLQWIRSYVSSSSKSHPGWPTPPPKPQSLEFQPNQA